MQRLLFTFLMTVALLVAYASGSCVSGHSDGVLPRAAESTTDISTARWSARAHDLIGTIVILAGVVALCAPKGKRLHRWAGRTYVVSMLTLAVSVVPMLLTSPSSMQLMLMALAAYLCASGTFIIKSGSPNAAPEQTTGLGFPSTSLAMVGLCLAAVQPLGVSYTDIPANGLALVGLMVALYDLMRTASGSTLTEPLRVQSHMVRMVGSLLILLSAGFFNICATFLLMAPAARWLIPATGSTLVLHVAMRFYRRTQPV